MKKLFILFTVCLLIITSVGVKAQSVAVQNDTSCSTAAGCDAYAANSIASSSATLYPNPATNELNVVFNPNADVKNIAVYNIIGKILAIYKVSANSANLNLENIPSGIYFVRLLNANGDPVVTRKFTKQ